MSPLPAPSSRSRRPGRQAAPAWSAQFPALPCPALPEGGGPRHPARRPPGLHSLRMPAYTRAMSTTDIDRHCRPYRPAYQTAPAATDRRRAARRRPARRASVRRHLRCALTGTLLAIVAITGLSAYAAQGIAEARSTALCQAHITCK